MLAPEAPDHILAIAHFGTTTTAIADAFAQHIGKATGEVDDMHRIATEQAEADRRQRLGNGEVCTEHAGGQHEH